MRDLRIGNSSLENLRIEDFGFIMGFRIRVRG